MEKVKRVLTQAEIQELRELIEYTDDDRIIELFKKFHATYNMLAVFYRDKKSEERRTLYFETELQKANEKIKKLEAEIKKLKM
ncbi:MAG: hypothetical protein MR691_08020 [Clostridium sp.]|nr:hypothetical protein [Clostridium sp.]